MPALLLSLAFVAYLTLVGGGLLAACRWRGGVLRTWLLAPAVGLAGVILGLMLLNQAGLPVRTFAWPLTLGLGVAAAGILRWRRAVLPRQALAPFAGVAVASLLWTGWPQLRFGFNWLSYVNDDFVNYCLAADRFRDFGFWRAPQLAELAGTDIAQYYWFMHVPGLMRFGSEITLAWVSALTGLKALGIFMPVILGLGLVQLAAAGALVLHRGRWRRRAWLTMALLAVSPLFMLGSLYQLIAQVGGLGLMLAATVVLTQRLPARRSGAIPAIVILSVLGAALCVTYPEVTAFAGLAGVVAAGFETVRQRRLPAARLTLFLYGVAGVMILLRTNMLSYVFTIMLQLGSGFRSVDLSLSLFPYFMIPTGLANLFGLMPLAVNFPEPYTSAAILVGGLALVAALAAGVREAGAGVPMALLLLVQFALALRLMTSGNDFGLYKLAMFLQPALAASLAGLIRRRPRRGLSGPLARARAARAAAPTALHYTRVSQGDRAGGLTEAKSASALGTEAPPVPAGTRVLADVNNLVAAKLAAAELRGTDLRYLSRDYYQQIAPIEYERLGTTLVGLHPHFDDLLSARPRLAERDARTVQTLRLFETTFRAPRLDYAPGAADAYLTLDPALGLFNKFRYPAPLEPRALFRLLPAAEVRNHLVFVHSGRGNHYYLGDRNRIAIFQQEADPYTPRQDFTGIGRFLLLRVERPDAELYVRLLATKTFMGPGHTAWAPEARLLGAEPVLLRLPGHGAVNRILGPVRPVTLGGAAYIALDLNELPVQFPFERSGLASLYNPQVPLDSRKLVAYARDISALGREEVAALRRPARLGKFPDDLLFASGLEYAGIYEDGWVSPESEFILTGTPAGGVARIRGFIPELPGRPLGAGVIRIRAGDRAFTVPARVGGFDWLLPLPAAAATTHLRLSFSAQASLPEKDRRPIGAQLNLVEVFPTLPTNTFEFGIAGGARLPARGIDQDGWLERGAVIDLPSGGPRVLRLRLEFPDWSGLPEGRITTVLQADVSAAGEGVVREHRLPAAQYSVVDLPVAASAEVGRLELRAGVDFPLPAPDQRRRTARLVAMELQPAP
ncbi:MAG: hypothetical protein ACO3G4_05195 [Opitutaceae bacterium]